MVLEFKNSLERELGCNLPSSVIFDYPNLTELITYLQVEILAPNIDFEVKTNSLVDPGNPYDSLNEDELAILLNQKLTEFDQYGE